MARTKPNRESWAAENLSRQDFIYYLPRIAEMVRYRDGVKMHVIKPLFRNYIFVLVQEDNWVSVCYTFGISGVMMSGEQPAIVATREIEKLKTLEGMDGLICLPERHTRGLFSPGDSVRIKSGAMSGMHGIYRGMAAESRVHVLLDYLGRKTKVLIEEACLEPAGG